MLPKYVIKIIKSTEYVGLKGLAQVLKSYNSNFPDNTKIWITPYEMPLFNYFQHHQNNRELIIDLIRSHYE